MPKLSRKMILSNNKTVGETSIFDHGDFWLSHFQRLPVIRILILLSYIVLLKIWPGEVWVVILSNSHLFLLGIETKDGDFAKAIEEYQ